MTERTNPPSQDQSGTAREHMTPQTPNTADLGELVARLQYRARVHRASAKSIRALQGDRQRADDEDGAASDLAEAADALTALSARAERWQATAQEEASRGNELKSALAAADRQFLAEKARADKAEAERDALTKKVATFLTAYDAVVESDGAIPWDRAVSDRVTKVESEALTELRGAAELHATLTGKTGETSSSSEGRRANTECAEVKHG